MDNSKAARIAVVRHGDDEQFDPAVVPAYLQQLAHPGTRTGLPHCAWRRGCAPQEAGRNGSCGAVPMGCHLTGTPTCAAGGRASSCLVRLNLGLISGSGRSRPGRRRHPHGLQIRTGVRCFSLRLLLYFAAVRAPGTVGSGFRIILLSWGRAMGIRTPDLLHAMGNVQVQLPSDASKRRPVPLNPHGPRPERRSDDGQNDLETAMDHTNTGREEAAIWQSSASQQAGANACTDGDKSGRHQRGALRADRRL